jgi:probable O-glycosylation ligase (exosortase A-associated)
MTPEATLKRQIPGVSVVLEDRTPFRWGMWFLLLFTLVVVGRIQEVIPDLAPLRVGFITGGLAALAWVLAPGSLQDKVPTQLPPVRYVLILLALAVLTIPISVWPGNSFEFLTEKYWKMVLLFLLVLFWCRSVQDMRRLIWVCCLGAIALVVDGLLTSEVGDRRFNASSDTYDPNDLALLLVMLLPFLLYLFSTSRGLLQIALSGIAVLSLYGIVLTQSRGGFLALVAVSMLILGRSVLSRASKATVVGVALLVFGGLAGSEYWDRIETIWAPQTEYDRTAGDRTGVWKNALMMMLSTPWGVGIGGFGIAEGLAHGGTGVWRAAHNSFLQIGGDLGVGGLIVFLLLILRTLGGLRHIQAKAKEMPSPNPLAALAAALEISLWGFMVGGFFLSQAYSGLLYIVLALSAACTRIARSAIPATS